MIWNSDGARPQGGGGDPHVVGEPPALATAVGVSSRSSSADGWSAGAGKSTVARHAAAVGAQPVAGEAEPATIPCCKAALRSVTVGCDEVRRGSGKTYWNRAEWPRVRRTHPEPIPATNAR